MEDRGQERAAQRVWCLVSRFWPGLPSSTVVIAATRQLSSVCTQVTGAGGVWKTEAKTALRNANITAAIRTLGPEP